ncbi:hypothetical protein GJ496_011134 [Pomphorhynchus laevis]|nr:hypothetical protein GJ496_011134 [Pomphorhynchus laevis]
MFLVSIMSSSDEDYSAYRGLYGVPYYFSLLPITFLIVGVILVVLWHKYQMRRNIYGLLQQSEVVPAHKPAEILIKHDTNNSRGN